MNPMLSLLRGVTRNWKLKSLAFALAVLLWIVVSAEQVTSNWLWVPLEVQVTDPDFRVIGNDLPREVQVRFTGPGRDLLDLALRKPPLRLTVSEVEDIVETRSLDPRMVQIPGQLAVSPLDVRPGAIRIHYTRVLTRMLPVRPQITDRFGAEYVIDTLSVEPDLVRAAGPAASLEGVTEISTLPFELTPADTVFDRTVSLDTAQLPGVELGTSAVRVSGRVDRIADRTFEGVRIDVGPGIAILPDRADVILRGPASALAAMTSESFRLVVSIGEIPARIPPGGVLVPLRVDRLREGVQARTVPGQVRLFSERQLGEDAVLPGVELRRDTMNGSVPAVDPEEGR